jgi:hypothetical protein
MRESLFSTMRPGGFGGILLVARAAMVVPRQVRRELQCF